MPETLEKRILDAREHMQGAVTAHCQAGRCEYAKKAICGYRELIDALSNKLKIIRNGD